MPQPFLEAGQHIDIRTGLDKNGPPSRKPDLFQGGGEHILAGDDPEHLATCASRNPGAELTGGGTVQGVIPTAGHFMKAPSASPPPGRRLSISRTPKGSTVRRRSLCPSRRLIAARSVSRPGFLWISAVMSRLDGPCAGVFHDYMFLICSNHATQVNANSLRIRHAGIRCWISIVDESALRN